MADSNPWTAIMAGAKKAEAKEPMTEAEWEEEQKKYIDKEKAVQKEQVDSVQKEARSSKLQDESIRAERDSIKAEENRYLKNRNNTIFSDENCKRVINARNPFSKDYKKEKAPNAAIDDRK